MSFSLRKPAVCRSAWPAGLRPARPPRRRSILTMRPFSSSVCTSSPPQAPPASAAPEPLRILFCGSDDFSCASLQALHDEMQRQKQQQKQQQGPGIIESLDVVVRPAKRTGRGRKNTHESPVKILATGLGLQIHERDTFTGWQPPSINLIVAVSFGLFVPARLIRGARYGGLNVHPSLLPDLHGATPIEHAILLGRSSTGVTVQTLDDKKFDGGRILLQGPAIGVGAEQGTGGAKIGIGIPPRGTAAELRQILAPIGAALLVQTLQNGLYLDGAVLPAPISAQSAADSAVPPPAPAPRLSKADQQVAWRPADPAHTTTAVELDRQSRAMGPLWTHVVPHAKAKKASKPGAAESDSSQAPPTPKRIILGDMEPVECPAALLSVLREAYPKAAESESPTSVPSSPLRTVKFVQQSKDGDAQQHVTLPFVIDETGDSIIVPVGVSHPAEGEPSADSQASRQALRIGSLKAEGDRVKPAGQAISAFATKGPHLNQISWDVALRK